MNFYLTQVTSSHGAFNAYLFHMKLADSPECSNCDTRGLDDDTWHTLFEWPAFRLYWEEAMTALEKMAKPPLTPDSLVLIMLKSAEGWDQVAAFVAVTMHRKMEIARERPTTQHPMPDLAIHPVFAISNPRKQKTIQAGPPRRHPAANLPSRPEILRS